MHFTVWYACYSVLYISPCPLPLAVSDYNQTSTSITLTGQETQVISVPIINDQIYEFAESFTASLSASGVLPSFVTLGPETAQVDIADDDSTLVDVCVCVHIIPGPKSSVFRKKAL